MESKINIEKLELIIKEIKKNNKQAENTLIEAFKVLVTENIRLNKEVLEKDAISFLKSLKENN